MRFLINRERKQIVILPHPEYCTSQLKNMGRLKNIRRTLRKPLETFFFKLAILLMPLIPRPFLTCICCIAGTITFYAAKRERTYGMANLDIVFGKTKTTSEKKKILKKALVSFTQTMADIFWFSVNTEKRVKKFQRFIPETGPFFEKRAQILITAHSGNWELLGLGSGFFGMDIASIAAVTKNAAVDKMLSTLRARTGQTIIPREGAMRTLISRLRKQGKAAFVLDQNTPEEQGGIWVDFLGMPTPVSSAPALLAYKTGSEIVFAFSRPAKHGFYEAHTGPVIQPPPFSKELDQQTIVKELTQQIMDIVSSEIRQHPEAWLWSYKHWRTIAPGTDPARYPSYE
jgi:KDO2-lipid IV(A) lauroyltransferase